MSSRSVVPLAMTAAVIVALGFSLRGAQRRGGERQRSLIPETVTVFAKETHDGRLQAVYSRAAYPDAAQYMGDCEPSR